MQEKTFIKIAKALADPTRHAIIRAVRRAGELTCTQVCERFDHSQPTISHHVKALDDAGILKIRKDGTFHRLTVNDQLLDDFARSIQGGETPKSKRRKS